MKQAKQKTYLYGIAVPSQLDKTFTYQSEQVLDVGQRVEVPFGRSNRKIVGVVWELEPEYSGEVERLKSILSVIDDKPIYSPQMLHLAKWLSGYYLHPIGEVLRTMLPGGGNTLKSVSYTIKEPFGSLPSTHRKVLEAIFSRKKELTESTFRSKLKGSANQLGREAEALEKEWLKQGVLEKLMATRVTVRKAKASETIAHRQEAEDAKQLTKSQNDVYLGLVKVLETPIEQRKPCLLWGVTGAGKTEIYLQLIQALLKRDSNAQALVMVPEISLTPQMTHVFERRFPGDLAVVHSALSQKERWERLDLIRTGAVRILIGPRSAIFAPFKQLSLVMVDEEHDSSYKQTTGLCYHGRDVAVVRGKYEGAMVLLGSATPSLESFTNAQMGKYEYFQLPERAYLGAQLPTVELVSNVDKKFFGLKVPKGESDDLEVDIPVSPDVIRQLNETVAAGQQAMVIVNRRGFAYYMYSLSEKKPVTCPHCSVSLTVHRGSKSLRCHYCDYSKKIALIKKQSPHDVFLTVGYGSEQAELFIQKSLPNAKVVRVDSDSVSKKDSLQTILSDFRAGKIDILVGTQLLAKGHDFAKVTLICLLETDQILNLPDFRAGERAFQLIVQAAGRAGRSGIPGHVLIQSQRPDHPVVAMALRQDFPSFAASESEFRKVQHFPPYSRMISFEWNSPYKKQVDDFSSRVSRFLIQFVRDNPHIQSQLSILGPTIPPIEVIRKRHRRTLILMGADIKNLWSVAIMLKKAIADMKGSLRVKVDVDPYGMF